MVDPRLCYLTSRHHLFSVFSDMANFSHFQHLESLITSSTYCDLAHKQVDISSRKSGAHTEVGCKATCRYGVRDKLLNRAAYLRLPRRINEPSADLPV